MATTVCVLKCTITWILLGLILLVLPRGHCVTLDDNTGYYDNKGQQTHDVTDDATHDLIRKYDHVIENGLVNVIDDKVINSGNSRKLLGIGLKRKKKSRVHSKKLFKWGKWGPPSGCSKPCGVGVKYKKRNCYKTSNDVTSRTSRHLCRGKDRVYMLCNKRTCKGGEGDNMRQQQCSMYNQKPYEGSLYEWTPYDFTGDNPSAFTQCQLVCNAGRRDSDLTVKLADQVVDGTTCRVANVQGICIEGKCRAIGCNKKLGSRRSVDRCGVCGGRNSTCKVQTGQVREVLERGYNTILTLPSRSTDIHIETDGGKETAMAIRTNKGRHLLSDKTTVDQPATKTVIAGTEFHYKHLGNAKMKLSSKEPTNQTLYVMILSPFPNTSIIITYSYTIPKRTRVGRRRHGKHKTRKNKINSNDVTSPGDTRRFPTSSTSRPVSHYFDLDERNISPTEEGLSQPATKTLSSKDTFQINNQVETDTENKDNNAPFIKYSGRTKEKDVVYIPPDGNENVITNMAYTDYDKHTHSYNENILTSVTQSPNYQNKDLKDKEQTNTTEHDMKYQWKVDMSLCKQFCNPKVPFALTRCYDNKDNEVDLDLCDVSGKPKVTSADCKRKCPCQPRWVASRWSRCSADCGSGYQYRTVRCWRILSPGLDSSVHNDLCQHLKKPVTVKKCKNIDCDEEPRWITSSWNKCSAVCGQGVQTRTVTCDAGVNRCRLKDKPASTRDCVLTSCENRMQWVVSKWSQCSERCGLQHRRVGCRSNNNGSYVNDTHCDVTNKPLSSQLCDVRDCPTDWVPQMWSKCSSICGEGTTFRSIVCGRVKKSVFERLPDSECEDILKPHAAASCRGRACPGQYTGKWYTGEWSQCSYSCGVGSRSRLVNCYLDSRPSDQCDVQTKPPSIEQCRLPPCSTAAARIASASTIRTCRDDPRLTSCSLVVQHKLCQHYYYRRACCQSCKGHR